MVSGSQLLSQHLSLGPEIRSLTLHPEKAMDRCSIYIERKRKAVLQPHKLTKQSKQPNVHVMPSQTEKVLTRVAEARSQKKYLALSVTACLFVCLFKYYLAAGNKNAKKVIIFLYMNFTILELIYN